MPVDTVLDDIQVLEFTPEEATKLRHGQKILAQNLTCYASNQTTPPANVFIAKCNGILVAICESGEGVIKPLRVFNL